MLWQILIGVGVIIATAIIHGFILSLALVHLSPLSRWAVKVESAARITLAVSATVIWIMIAHILGVALWALVFVAVDAIPDADTAFYFSLVAYTTLGLGDILPGENWDILTGLCAANGFLIFGWSTAFQVQYFDQLNKMRAELATTES